jgi:CRP/FNR family transcriptional regulator
VLSLFSASNATGVGSPGEHSGPDDGLRKLWESSSPRLLKAGQHLFRAGDARLELYKVKSGTIRIYKNLEDARRQVMGFRFASDVIGLELQPRYLYSAQAIGAAILHRVPIAAVHALAVEDASVLFELHARLADELAAAQDLALTIGRADPEERLARFLVVLFRRNRRHRWDPAAVDLSMPRTDIADHLGLTMETVSRTLTKLAKHRFIKLTRRRSVQLLNMDALETLAQGRKRTSWRGRSRR